MSMYSGRSAFSGILIIASGLFSLPAQALEVVMTFSVPVVGNVGASFTGFDYNGDGYIRSSENEVARARAESSFGNMSFEISGAEPPEVTGIDIEYKYWVTSISPNVIATQLNKFSITSSYDDMSNHEDHRYSYIRSIEGGGSEYPYPAFSVDYSKSESFSHHTWPVGTSFNTHSQSRTDYLVEMRSSGPVVPEPSTFALMMIGFSAMGFVAYRRVR